MSQAEVMLVQLTMLQDRVSTGFLLMATVCLALGAAIAA